MRTNLYAEFVDGKAGFAIGKTVTKTDNPPDFLKPKVHLLPGQQGILEVLMKSRLISMQQRTAFDRWVRPVMACLLASMLTACASQAAAPRPDKPSHEAALLDQLGALARADMPRVDLDVLSTLADADMRALVQAQQKGAATSDGAVSVTKGVAKPGVAVTGVTYRLTPTGPVSGAGRRTTEEAILVLNPVVVCITDKAIQQQWGEAMQSGSLGALRYGPGGLWPMDGLHRNKAEQARRGNGPIEVVVAVNAPADQSHKSSFNFTHEYWACARSVTLERRF